MEGEEGLNKWEEGMDNIGEVMKKERWKEKRKVSKR